MAEIAPQTWLAGRYAENAGFVPALGAPVLDTAGLAHRPIKDGVALTLPAALGGTMLFR